MFFLSLWKCNWIKSIWRKTMEFMPFCWQFRKSTNKKKRKRKKGRWKWKRRKNPRNKSDVISGNSWFIIFWWEINSRLLSRESENTKRIKFFMKILIDWRTHQSFIQLFQPRVLLSNVLMFLSKTWIFTSIQKIQNLYNPIVLFVMKTMLSKRNKMLGNLMKYSERIWV